MEKQFGAVLAVPRDTKDDRARRSSPLPDRSLPAQARTGRIDPLAELARRIEQDEAFAAIPRNGGRSGPRAELSVDPKDAPSLGYARGDVWPAHDGDGDEEADFANGGPGRRRGLRVFAALIGLALAGSASAFAYWLWSDGRLRIDEARMIGAPATPDKIMPSPPREDSRSDERPDGKSDQPSARSADRTILDEEKRPDAEPAAAVPPAGVPNAPAPPEVAGPTSAPATPTSPAAPAPNQPPPSNDAAATQAAPEATKPGVAQYVVQLSSQRSEAAAQATSKTLQTKYPDLFAGRQPFIRRSDLGERGVYYRVLIGPLATSGEAHQLCGNLKKSGGDCVVQKN